MRLIGQWWHDKSGSELGLDPRPFRIRTFRHLLVASMASNFGGLGRPGRGGSDAFNVPAFPAPATWVLNTALHKAAYWAARPMAAIKQV